jgi:hypothetical protein
LSDDYSPTTARVLLGLVLLFSLVVRLSALDHGPYGLDSWNYCIGALKFHIAHPPGYAGYVALGSLLNLFVHHINRTFIGISLVSALASVVLIFALSRLMGLKNKTALAAAITYSLSVNVLVFSVLAMNYTLESCLALLFACLAIVAIQRRSTSVAIAATIVFAASGSVRPTTTFFLVPLWLYFLWRMRPTLITLGVHLLIAAFLIGVWQYANSHLLARAGFQGSAYGFQVMMPVNYDYVSLNNRLATTEAARPAFHMPGFEILAWTLDHLHLKLLPKSENWPQPSLRRAGMLSGVQFLKFCYFLFFSVPALLVLPFTFLRGGQNGPAALCASGRVVGKTPAERGANGSVGQYRWFFFWWIVPAFLFFVFGHLGSIGYLLFFQPAIVIWLTQRVFESQKGRNGLKLGYASAALLGVVFFLFARPFRSDSGWRRTVDILALVNTAASIREEFSVSRNTTPGPVSPPLRAMSDAPSDEAFLQAAERAGYTPIPQIAAQGD